MAVQSDKKTPPGGERFRGGANKGTGILGMETFVPRQLVKYISKHYAKNTVCGMSAVNSCFSGGLGGLQVSWLFAQYVPLMAHYFAVNWENAKKLGDIAVPLTAQGQGYI
jgi:hypothetical protein